MHNRWKSPVVVAIFTVLRGAGGRQVDGVITGEGRAVSLQPWTTCREWPPGSIPAPPTNVTRAGHQARSGSTS